MCKQSSLTHQICKFQPADAQDYVNKMDLNEKVSMNANKIINSKTTRLLLKNLEYCTKEHSLPYVRMIHGRLLLTILELDIEYIDLNSIYLIAEATIYLLKNILTKLINYHKIILNKHVMMMKKSVIETKQLPKCVYMDEDEEENYMSIKQEINDLNYLNNYSVDLNSNQFISLYRLRDMLQVSEYCILKIL